MNNREIIEFTVNELREHASIHPTAVVNLINLVDRKLEDHLNPAPSIAEDVAPAESEDTHYTQGGVDDDKEIDGFGGFANGAK